MKRVMASVLVAAFLAVGCTGSFNLTKKVYNFHRSQADKWTDELCFLLVAITPIYGFATFADAIVFNSIEFWSGKNPIDAKAASQERIAEKGKDKVLMSYNSKTDQVHVASAGNKGVIFERSATGVIAKDEHGKVLFSSVSSEQGNVAIYDAQGKLVKDYPAGQIALLKEEYLKKQ
jgi:hypothetical protein